MVLPPVTNHIEIAKILSSFFFRELLPLFVVVMYLFKLVFTET